MLPGRLASIALLLALDLLKPKTEPPPASPAPAEAAPAPPAIELATLPRTLEDDRSRVRLFAVLAKPSASLLEVKAELPGMAAKLAGMEATLLAASPDRLTFRELDLMRLQWLGADTTLSGWEGTLEHDAKVVDDARKELNTIEANWRAAYDTDWHGELSPALTEKIDDLVLKTVAAREGLNEQTAALLVTQDEVATDRARVREAIDRTFALSKAVSEAMFAVEGVPLWTALSQEPTRFPLATQTVESVRAAIASTQHSLQGERSAFFFQLLLYAGLVAAAIYLARRIRRDPAADDAAKVAAAFLDRPFAAAGVLALFGTFFIYTPTAVVVRETALSLLIVPYIRLVPKVLAPQLHRAAYGLGALFLLDRAHDFALPHSLLQRVLLVLTGLFGVVGWAWAHRATARAQAASASAWHKGWRVIARIAIGALALAVVANAVGNISLAEQLTVVAVKGVFAGGLLTIMARVLESYWVLLLRLAGSWGSRVVQANGELLERRGRKTIRAGTFALWLLFVLWIMRIIEQSGAVALAIFNKRWTVGSVQVGLGAVIAFATALTLGILVARMLRFVLDEAIFPRMALPRGVPAAISTTVGYVVTIAGLVMAFLAAGLEMSQFTFLAGAFGVGIGFGLQNVVNNFVSGLILLYERPIQVGDVLEVGTVQGHVRRIGIRSSTLGTFDGAEVIVPNANLISANVVNWTLSDRIRRVQIQVGASYGTEPQKVLDILNRVARAHPEVLKSPEPNALFVSFGDSSLNFELRFWTPEYDAYVRVASEVRTAIFAAFKEAGIEIPFPQREVRVVHPTGAAG